jgi:hypothetical protein
MDTPNPALSYVLYSDSLEKEHPNEAQTFSELAATMRHISEIVNERSRHAFRAVHAKSHCLLKAEMTVLDDIGAPFQQGLLQAGSQYPIIMRFSTNPGDVLPDSISSPRGLAAKVVGIANAEMVPNHVGQVTQDFVLVNGSRLSERRLRLPNPGRVPIRVSAGPNEGVSRASSTSTTML